jgi:hypothetical protein
VLHYVISIKNQWPKSDSSSSKSVGQLLVSSEGLALDVLIMVLENQDIRVVAENTKMDRFSNGAISGGGDVVEHRHPEQGFDVDIIVPLFSGY